MVGIRERLEIHVREGLVKFSAIPLAGSPPVPYLQFKDMKVLGISGSPIKNGNVDLLIKFVASDLCM